ncbi:putative cytochrome P450 12c1, mitochondrial isoform X2 [Haematobia irritans]|uniref:putative cytochrome P450 12c1, mitochondrial isoform X2 n=1 Tax=Haematobia irritans TaxID=7368 RepID=UPI003F4F8341
MLSTLFKKHNRKIIFKGFWAFRQSLTCSTFKSSIPESSENSYVGKLKQEWHLAKPFTNVPGPSKFQMLRGFLKGGDFHGKSFENVMRLCRQRYGDLYLLPGMFGQNTNLISFNLDDHMKVFRTEGQYPIRPGNELMFEYRLSRNDDLYDENNLGVAGNGPQWSRFRHAVNPVLMQPKNARLYIEPTEKASNEFINRIRKIRNPTTLEVPDDFLHEIKCLAFDSVAAIALDKDLGLVRHEDALPEAQELFHCMQSFTKAFYDLGIKPSIYKYVRTPTYKRFEYSMDFITNICRKYVDETLQGLEQHDYREHGYHRERSVLEKLIRIDRKIAIIMAVDLLLFGVEPTSSIMSGLLLCVATNPEKQEILRKEILKQIGKRDHFTIENMNNLPYLRACIKEAIRIYPLVFGNNRTTAMDLCLSGYQIPKGTNVFLVSNLLLQEEKYFPKPKEFLPERWLRDNTNELKATSIPNIYLPFGFGPRSCVGKRIVELQLELTLANIVRNFQMEYNYSTENAFENYFVNTCVLPLKFKFKDLN